MECRRYCSAPPSVSSRKRSVFFSRDASARISLRPATVFGIQLPATHMIQDDQLASAAWRENSPRHSIWISGLQPCFGKTWCCQTHQAKMIAATQWLCICHNAWRGSSCLEPWIYSDRVGKLLSDNSAGVLLVYLAIATAVDPPSGLYHQ